MSGQDPNAPGTSTPGTGDQGITAGFDEGQQLQQKGDAIQFQLDATNNFQNIFQMKTVERNESFKNLDASLIEVEPTYGVRLQPRVAAHRAATADQTATDSLSNTSKAGNTGKKEDKAKADQPVAPSIDDSKPQIVMIEDG